MKPQRRNSRTIVRTPANSLLLGEMPEGCKLCIMGAKLVLFVTGLCSRGCYYCPLSERRKGRDVVYANERQVRSTRDIIEEAKLIDALGTGLTGGDPSTRFRRVLRYLRLLKFEFGKKHHVHMYCGGELSTEQLRELKQAGLDELRFHTWSVEHVELALQVGIRTGVEVPAIPGGYRELKTMLRDLDHLGCDFVNLNELEFSDSNLAELRARGFRIKSDETMAVKGSEGLALKAMRWAAKRTHLNIHYCPSALKDGVQLRNRLRRRARNVVRPHEIVTDDGLLIKGILRDLHPTKLASTRRDLITRYGIPAEFIVVDSQKRRIEMHWRVAEKLAKLERGMEFALVEEYPTHDRLETTLIPL